MPANAAGTRAARLRQAAGVLLLNSGGYDRRIRVLQKSMQIELHKSVAARPAVVFKTVADIMDWPRIIRSVVGVELLSTGRVRAGTRIRVNRIMYGHEMVEGLEIETFERPRRLRLVGESRGMHYERDHLIDALHVGSRLSLIFRNRPETSSDRAAQDFFTPLMQINLRDELERDLADLAAAASQSGAKLLGMSAH
jgi:Polyketide cyclase / dehydrase and lipid transport